MKPGPKREMGRKKKKKNKIKRKVKSQNLTWALTRPLTI
jgi:hypothetical protein